MIDNEEATNNNQLESNVILLVLFLPLEAMSITSQKSV